MSNQSVRLHVEKAAVPTLTGPKLQAARTAWVTLAILAVVTLVAALPGYAAKFAGQLGFSSGAELLSGSHFFAAASGVASLASALLSLGLSALLFRTKFREPVAALLSFFLLFFGIVLGGPLEFATTHWLAACPADCPAAAFSQRPFCARMVALAAAAGFALERVCVVAGALRRGQI